MFQEGRIAAAGPVPNRNADLHLCAVRRVIAAMYDHIYEPLSLGDMADIAHLSRFHFNRLFRNVVGIPPKQFLYALRLEQAKRLLAQTECSVTEICFEVGYNSLGSFTSRFHELVGTTPNGFRKLAQSRDLGADMRAVYACCPHAPPGGSGIARARYGIAWPRGFKGVAFVGLFKREMPGGQPIACQILAHPGPFRLPGVRNGRYSLFAIGLAWDCDPAELLLPRSALRGVAGPFETAAGRPAAPGRVTVDLIAPSDLHPPILSALPGVIAARLRPTLRPQLLPAAE